MKTRPMSDALERIRAARAKKAGGTPQSSSQPAVRSTTQFPHLEISPEGEKRLVVKRYYDIVTNDISRSKEALDFFRVAVENAYQHATAFGNLLILAQETPGLQALYGGIQVDASQIRKYLEERLNIDKAKKIKWLMNDPESRKMHGELKITEAKQWCEADDQIADLTLLVRRFANAENQLTNIMNGFTTRSVMIAKITTIREAGLEEVWVDPGRETTNE